MDPMILHKQWAERPPDERFPDMEALHAFNVAKRERSLEYSVPLNLMRLTSDGDRGGMMLATPGMDDAAYLTHWSFGQLCQRAHAPAGYLRTLPPMLAAMPLQWSMEQGGDQDAKVLARSFVRANGLRSIDALTSNSYGRIWDAEMSGSIKDSIDLTKWKIPAASYATRDPKRATTLYASDRDCFICLVDDEHPIEVPGREQDRLFRGFIVHNSEVGQATYELWLFLYRMICDNRIIHGLGESHHLRIRHTSGGPVRFMYQAAPALQKFVEAGTQNTVEAIRRANDKTVAKDDRSVMEWMKNRGFSQGIASRALAIATVEESDNPYSLWAVVQGLTAAARDEEHGDERLDLELKASKLLDAVAA